MEFDFIVIGSIVIYKVPPRLRESPKRPFRRAHAIFVNECYVHFMLNKESFWNSYLDGPVALDLFLQLWKIILFDLEIKSSQSWRLI